MKSNNFKFHGIALLAGLMSLTAHGATLLSISNANARDNRTTNVGGSFVVGSSDLSVTSLGFQDFDDNGLVGSHAVGLWTSGGTLLATVSVPSGTGATLLDHFRYVTLGGAVTLTAGQTYFIGAHVTNAGGDSWSDGAAGTVTPSPSIGSYNATFTDGASLTRPTGDGGAPDTRWGPANMQFTVVPEPGAALLGGLGALCLLRRRRN